MTLRELLGIYFQILNDRMPDPMPEVERKKNSEIIKKFIEEKYNFRFYVENGILNINGFTGDINEILDK